MGIADLHIHSLYSYDGIYPVSTVMKHIVEHTDLSLIAITDHDEITGALEAQQLAPAYGLQVVTGSEVTTAEGHVLALFIDRRVPSGLSLIETVLRVGAMGGLCIAAHPAAPGAGSLSFKAIRNAVKWADVARVLVGVEAFNAGLFHRGSNIAAWNFANSLPVAQVGNSDSHILRTLGLASTGFPGETAEDLRSALLSQTTSVQVSSRLVNGWSIIGSWLPLYMLRKAGWVRWNAYPQAPVRFGRAAQVKQSSAVLLATR
jgi:predicted metal-dependent phosphoesterase TrpH